jgi:hypothetical protein
MSSVNTVHEYKLRSNSGTRNHSFVSVYHVSSVSNDNILMWIFEV